MREQCGTGSKFSLHYFCLLQILSGEVARGQFFVQVKQEQSLL